MMIVLPLLIGAIAGGLLGLCAGWLARGREEVVVEKVVTQTVEKVIQRTADDAAQRCDQAAEILSQLQLLTTGVRARIAAHSRTVGNINEELAGALPGDVALVLEAIRRLVESNTAMQAQLQISQTRLAEQSALLETRQVEARTDSLTRLGNRRAFDDELARRMEHCAAGGGSLSMMMLDVDHFKRCNDTHGHLAGDEVLRMVGRVLAQGTAEVNDACASRYGGEEFALLFSDLPLPAAAEQGDRIRRRIEQSSLTFDGQRLAATASAGIALWQPGDTTASFIARADEALYAAKTSGRNRLHLHDQGSIRSFIPAPATGPQGNSSAGPPVLDANEAFSKAIHRRIAEWRRGGAKLSLIVCRIDGLGALASPDSSGHEGVLQEAGRSLKKMLREMDEIAPLGGGLFGVLLPSARLTEAVQIAERMRAVSSDEAAGSSLLDGATFCIGVAEVMENDDGDSLLLRARRAMEAARRRGGNDVYVNDGVYSTPAPEVLDPAAT